LTNLIQDEILIREVKKKKYDKTEESLSEKKRIELQELLNAYSNKHISPNLYISDDDLRDYYSKFNSKIKVSHLYGKTKEKADLLYNELERGKNFEELAKENFNDPRLKECGGLLG
jgi:hypothetical protein